MSRYVAIVTGGEMSIHFPHTTGNYATLCGVDGDDLHSSVDQKTVGVPAGRRVNCVDCVGIFDTIKSFREKDIERRKG